MNLVKYSIYAFLLISTILSAQESRVVEITAQEILARVDDVMAYPSGELKGDLMHILPDGRSINIKLKGYITRENSLFTFFSSKRGNEMRILNNLNGEDIWVYDILSLKLYHKIDVDKYDPLFASNYTFIDLSNADFQSNYTAAIIKKSNYKGKEVIILRLTPIFKGGNYGMLTLYVVSDNYLPLRIDYHDTDKVIMKTLSFTKMSTFDKRKFPVRYDMLHIESGTLSILQFSDYDKTRTYPATNFRHENLSKID